MAMIGGIVLAMSASAAAGRPTADGAVGRISPPFQAGRIGGFGLLGAALGALGGRTAMPQPAVVAVMVIVAVAMLLVGLRLTELSPRLAGWSPTIPAVIGDRLGLTGDVPARRTAGAAFAGSATFFLPCGFTQACSCTRSPPDRRWPPGPSWPRSPSAPLRLCSPWRAHRR